MSKYGFPSAIYDKITGARKEMLDVLPQPTMISRRSMTDRPSMHGGLRAQAHPTPAMFSPREPATLATGSSVGSMMPSADKRKVMSVYKGGKMEPVAYSQESGGKINWKKIGRSIKKVAMPILKEVAPVAKQALLTYGKKALMDYMIPAAETAVVAGAGIHRRKSCGGEVVQGSGRKPNARAAIVKDVMAKRGVGMIEASKIVKAEGLY